MARGGRTYPGRVDRRLVGLVVLGGIKRIGAVAGALVPFMCGIYLLAALYVVALRIAARGH